jgi:hypothetical protein
MAIEKRDIDVKNNNFGLNNLITYLALFTCVSCVSIDAYITKTYQDFLRKNAININNSYGQLGMSKIEIFSMDYDLDSTIDEKIKCSTIASDGTLFAPIVLFERKKIYHSI